jgi:hypothetical protein
MRRPRPSKLYYRPGLHLAMHSGGGSYRPAVVLEDGGGLLVKVRYTSHGLIQEEWVHRLRLIPPPWIGPRRP